MRLSVQQSDPGYHDAAHLCRVFLAGSERKNVLTADEERRYALLHRLDEKGQFSVKDGELQTEEFFGDVRIEVPDQLRQLFEASAPVLPST